MSRVHPVVVVGLLWGSGLVSAQPAPAVAHAKIAVVTSVAVNLDAAHSDALTGQLAEALADELEVDAIGGLEVRRRLPPDGIAPECQTIPSCVTELGATLGASQLLFVTIVQTGKAVQVDTAWVEPATGKHENRAPIDIADIDEAKLRFAGIAHQLLPDAPIRKKVTLRGQKGKDGRDGRDGRINGVMSPDVPRHFTTASIVTSAIGVAGLGVGIGFGLHTRSAYDACTAPHVCAQSTKDSIRLTGLVADGGYLLAIGGAIATSILFATSKESAHFVVTPTVEPAGGVTGMTVGAFGSF